MDTLDRVGTYFTKALNDRWSFSGSPRVVRLNGFTTGEGSGARTLGSNDQQLQVQLQQQSSSAFGLTSNAYPHNQEKAPAWTPKLNGSKANGEPAPMPWSWPRLR